MPSTSIARGPSAVEVICCANLASASGAKPAPLSDTVIRQAALSLLPVVVICQGGDGWWRAWRSFRARAEW